MSNDKISIDAKIIEDALEKEAKRQFKRLSKKERDKYFKKILTEEANGYKKQIETLKRSKAAIKKQLEKEREKFEKTLATAAENVVSVMLQSIAKGLNELKFETTLNDFVYSECCEYYTDDDHPSLSEIATSTKKTKFKGAKDE